MSTITMTTANEPDGAPRIATLDVMRGIAILGILFMNIDAMGGPVWGLFGDIRLLGWTTADQVVWWLREIFAYGTARCLLEMLFGVGMVILTDRAATALDHAGWSGSRGAVLRGYYWRNFVLFLFGLVHMFILLWPGDILHTYGIAAMVAFLFRRLGPKTLLYLGMLMALLQLFGTGVAIHMSQQARIDMPRLEARAAAGEKLTTAETKQIKSFRDRINDRAKEKVINNKRIARENRQRSADTATFSTWVESAWTSALAIWGVSDGIGGGMLLEPLFIWEAAGTMLIGAALYKWGVIQGQRSRLFYVRLTIAAYVVGLTGRVIGAYYLTRFDHLPHLITATSEVTRVATTVGHLGLVALLVASGGGARLLRPFAAAGRTALTIYILQTIICQWILYSPFGLGLYGKMSWAALMATGVAVNGLLLWAATVWVRHYDMAPVEWAWRSIVEWRMLPWRKRMKAQDNAMPGAIPAV